MDHLGLQVGDVFRPQYYASSKIFQTGEDFFAFPKRCEWNESTGKFSNPDTNIDGFLQQWLFFGLLKTVLQDSNFNENNFIRDGYINTGLLPKYLLRWEERAKASKNGITMQMINAQLALDRSREVVSKYCSLTWDNWDKTSASIMFSDSVDSELALSLMVLGETLTNAKCRIVERVGFTIRGWHGDANEGWGVPWAVVTKMIRAGWCKRTVYVMSCQLKSHATALLAAYKAYSEIEHSARPFNILQGHNRCTIEECLFKSTEADQTTYKPRHRHNCDESKCTMKGPEVQRVVDVIEEGHIPLLEFDGSSSQVTVKVYGPSMTYATVSHVWSDGHGNREATELAECQLKYISQLIKKSRWHDKDQLNPLFWIDTLAIPRHGEHDAARTKAVQRIDEVYRNAKFTIVIDLALDHVSPGEQYYEVAMRILASGWMRRLWTLQEAYLSKRILFAFRNDKLMEVDEIEDKYSDAEHSLVSNMATSARVYFHHIMGPERRSRIHNVRPENPYDVISSVWRSAQWRTIKRKADETVVLRALFELNRKLAPSISQNPQSESGKKRVNLNDPGNPTNEELATMMKSLWTSLEERSPGCIPSGIIFLPGPRLPLKGFGWAPSTWMSGREVEHPDPLALPQSNTKLIYGKGLSVRYPGFLLHYKRSDTVFWPNDKPIHFPSDSTLLEWYEVERADLKEETPKGTQLERMRFALIICRPKPRERKEIALLVNIVDEIHQGLHGSSAVSKVYKAQIVCRVWIRREIKIDRSSKWDEFRQQTGDDGEDFICGEELHIDQEWLVDGHIKEPPLPGPSELVPQPVAAAAVVSPPVASHDGPVVHRAFTRGQRGRGSGQRGQSGRSNTGPSGTSRTASTIGPPRRAETFNDSSGPANASRNGATRGRGIPNGGLARRTTFSGS